MMGRLEFLWRFGGGLGGIAMAHLLGTNGLLADALKPRPDFNGGLHHRARARRVVQMFMSGAASQCDTFDYKPALARDNGLPVIVFSIEEPGNLLKLLRGAGRATVIA